MKKLLSYAKCARFGSSHIAAEICPDNLLCATLSSSKLPISPMLSSSGPTIWLLLTSSTVKFFSFPISLGKHDEKPLFVRTNSFKFPIFPKLEGIHPSNLLLAKTITETGELPIFSGKAEENRLLFMKIASKSFSKSPIGSLPSNSLYRMSKYLRLGNWRKISGNFPAKRLLLRSSSDRSCKLAKL